jgi:thioesterase domain-containing protein
MAELMTEEQMAALVRNALLVAGFEMGETGEHWPVINSTIYSLAEDLEEMRIQKNVDAEMKIHLYEHLDAMEKHLPKCSVEIQTKAAPILKRLREIYDAYFSPLDTAVMAPIRDEEIPDYIKRAKTIIATLGEENV